MGEEVKNYLKKHQCLDCCGCLEINYIYCIYINRNHYFYSMQGCTFHFVSLILQTAVAVVVRFERNHPWGLIHGSRSNDVPIYIYHKSMYYIICLHLPERNQPNKWVNISVPWIIYGFLDETRPMTILRTIRFFSGSREIHVR